MNKINIGGLLGIFVIGIMVGVLGTIFFMNGEPKKATAPLPTVKETPVPSVEERERVLPVEEVVVPSVEVEQKMPEPEESPVLVQEKPIALKDQTDGCKGPFGVDSQKILLELVKEGFDHRLWSGYKIGIVAKIDLDKSSDGTWHVKSLEMISGETFSPSYRGNYKAGDYKVGDFIGYRTSIPVQAGQFLEHISSQSADCKIDDISGLSNPSKTIPIYPPSKKEDFVSVTGVIMAVSIEKNLDPEPDNPDDWQIHEAVMKCADGNLYRIEFESTVSRTPRINLPAHDAFGEGYVVIVMQINSPNDELKSTLVPEYYNRDYRTFRAYYEKDKNSSNGQ